MKMIGVDVTAEGIVDRVWVVEMDVSRIGEFRPTAECGYTREHAELTMQRIVQRTLEAGDHYPVPMRVRPYIREQREGDAE